MADKTGMVDLFGVLENLCLEHGAFFQMAKDSDVRWAARLHDYRTANRSRFARMFDAVLVEFRKTPDSPEGFRQLKEILETALLKQ
jgi:hypothetical protein